MPFVFSNCFSICTCTFLCYGVVSFFLLCCLSMFYICCLRLSILLQHKTHLLRLASKLFFGIVQKLHLIHLCANHFLKHASLLLILSNLVSQFVLASLKKIIIFVLCCNFSIDFSSWMLLQTIEVKRLKWNVVSWCKYQMHWPLPLFVFLPFFPTLTSRTLFLLSKPNFLSFIFS